MIMPASMYQAGEYVVMRSLIGDFITYLSLTCTVSILDPTLPEAIRMSGMVLLVHLPTLTPRVD